MWVNKESPQPRQPNHTIGSKKSMISVIWGRKGIVSIDILPDKQKFNKEFFSNVVLNDLSKQIDTNGIYFHCNNARPHLVQMKFEQFGMIRLPHPPYSPDLAPSDFFLFGYLKHKIQGFHFRNANELYYRVKNALDLIPKQCFIDTYDEWMDRLSKVIESGGEYII